MSAPRRRCAASVTERVWTCVGLQWAWLHGEPAVAAPREELERPREQPTRRRRVHLKLFPAAQEVPAHEEPAEREEIRAA